MKRKVKRLLGMLLLCSAFGALPIQNSHADLVLNLSGAVGSNIVNWEATGTGFTVTQLHAENLNSGAARVPEAGDNTWENNFFRNLNPVGDENNPVNVIAGASQSDLPLLGGTATYQWTDVSAGTTQVLNQWVEIDLTNSNTDGNDDIRLAPTTATDYPALEVGDIVFWAGSGTFALTGGETYDTYFASGPISVQNVGPGTSGSDGGNYVVNIAAAAVPEPGSIAILGLSGMLMMVRRRRIV